MAKLVNGETLKDCTAESYATTLENRGTVIEIANYTNKVLKEPNNVIIGGTPTLPLPPTIGPFTKEITAFKKTSGSIIGCEGVVSYVIDDETRLAIMYFLPYGGGSNWFALALIDEFAPTNDKLFYEMYNGSDYDGSNPDRRREYASGGATVNVKRGDWRCSAKMSNEEHAILQVRVQSTNEELRRQATDEDGDGANIIYVVFDPPETIVFD